MKDFYRDGLNSKDTTPGKRSLPSPYFGFWHERAAFQRSSLGRSTTGNDVVATILISLISVLFSPFSPFSAVTFSHRKSAWIKKLISQKLAGAPKNLGVHPFPDPIGHFGAPWQPFQIFEVLREAGGKVLQAVRCCRREQVPPSPLGWYCILLSSISDLLSRFTLQIILFRLGFAD